VTVSEARALAARWVAEHAAGTPGFAGALLGGSAAWSPAHAELPASSDVDVMVVTDDQAGLLRPGTVLADPSGRLARLQAATATDYPRRAWVRRRCRDAEQRILAGLERLDPSAPLPTQVLAWLFPTGVTTHVLLTAGLRNRPCGCATWPPGRCWPTTAGRGSTRSCWPCSAGPSCPANGSSHREAVFWIAATYARCLAILAGDAPGAAPGHTPGFEELLGDLGIASPADLGRRAGEVRGFLPRLGRVAEAILAANPDARD
jgi:hypothetical protein